MDPAYRAREAELQRLRRQRGRELKTTPTEVGLGPTGSSTPQALLHNEAASVFGELVDLSRVALHGGARRISQKRWPTVDA